MGLLEFPFAGEMEGGTCRYRGENRIDHVKDCPQNPRCNDKVTSPVKARSHDTLIAEILQGELKKKKSKYILQASCFCQVKVGLNLLLLPKVPALV